MREDLLDARRTFLNMPEEVFTLWLDGRILANGWPPMGPEWAGFLVGHSVAQWQKLKWTKRDIQIGWNLLGPLSRQLVQQLIEGNVNGKKNPMMAYIPNSKQRFRQITKYALDHHNIPGTLVLLMVNHRLEIVDGNHRVAALVALQTYKETKDVISHLQTAWVGQWDHTEQPPERDK